MNPCEDILIVLDQLIVLDRLPKTITRNKARLKLEMQVVNYHEMALKPKVNIINLQKYVANKKYLSVKEAVIIEGKENLLKNAFNWTIENKSA